MRTHKTAIQAAAITLSERAEECFVLAEDQHENAALQHANAEKLAALGTVLEADAAKLFGETQLPEGPPPLAAPVDAASALKALPKKRKAAA